MGTAARPYQLVNKDLQNPNADLKKLMKEAEERYGISAYDLINYHGTNKNHRTGLDALSAAIALEENERKTNEAEIEKARQDAYRDYFEQHKENVSSRPQEPDSPLTPTNFQSKPRSGTRTLLGGSSDQEEKRNLGSEFVTPGRGSGTGFGANFQSRPRQRTLIGTGSTAGKGTHWDTRRFLAERPDICVQGRG